MNQHPQRQPSAPPAKPAASTPTEARKLAEDMVEVMSALLGIIERETELVRAGKVHEAMQMEQQKGDLSRRYVIALENLKAAQNHLAQAAPDLLATLRRHHETFRAMLQINLTVLAIRLSSSVNAVSKLHGEVTRAMFRVTSRPFKQKSRFSDLRCHRRNLDFVERIVLNRADLLEANQLEQREKSHHDLDTGDDFAKQI